MDVLQWNRDRVSGSLTDNDAHFLTDQGIETIQNVLDCSKLEYLRIHSEPLKPDIEHSVGKALQAALQAVQWSMVKYLVIVGSDVDSWIRVWADQGCLLESTIGHQLQTLKVIGTGSACQRLTHPSALAVHGFLYSCARTDLT
ncbi:hypothetical protein BGZ92_003458 [Podila epicladia]|nr:hypothetical protein BGZ92_003458 [Podila epicladia]